MEAKKSKQEIAKRYILFTIGLLIMGFGVAVTKRGELGVSPISSVANVLSIKLDFLTLGNWLIIWNFILLLGQVLILRKDFRLIQLLQIPLSFLFGYFTDIGMKLVSVIDNESYFVRLGLVISGTIILGMGVAITVIADVVMNSGEAFVKAVSDKINKNFGNVKIAFDIFCVAASILISLFCFGFTIVGTREGTIFAALFTGVAVKLFLKILSKPVEKSLSGFMR